MTNPHANELRDTYLYAFDTFAVQPSDVVRDVDGVDNIRYARELLGTLVQANLLVIDTVNGDEDVWQVSDPGTHDSATREEAEATIDRWIASSTTNPKEAKVVTTTASKPSTKNDNPADLPICRCGTCGLPVGRKSLYKPGHDARHAGNVARKIAQDGDFGHLDELPSDALKAKADAMARRLIEKVSVKAAATQEGTVKAGRYEYPARKHADGKVERRENSDGTGEWVEAKESVAKTFKAA